MPSTSHDPAAAHSRPFLLYLIATSLLCGSLVMVIEVLGSRVIGPFFGASLFVWTALITVTLVALAAGYSVGGLFADRQRSPGWLYGIILVAGVMVLFIPLLKLPVLKLTLPLGVRGGALAAASLLFGPALFLLGCVSPFIIKIAAREMANIGRTVGLFSAISTVGSFVGTVCTGFVLIAYFQVNQIFLVVGGALVAIAVGYFALFRRRWQLLPLILLPLVFPHGGTAAPTKLLADGTRVTRLLARDSFYGNLQVHDYSFADKRTREFVIDGTTQGGIDLANGMSIYEYAYFLQYLPTAINPGGKRCLAVGLGAGVVPMWYDRQGIVTDVVDIDPDVFRIAHDYFDFRVTGQEHVADARHFLNTTGQSYDYIILDVFNGDNTPFHIMSREALLVLKQRLTPTGVLGINMAGSLTQKTFMTASVVRTLKAVFATVEVYPAFSLNQHGGVGNLEVFAYDRPAVPLDYARLRTLPVHPLAASTLQKIDAPFRFPEATPAMVLTDNYNPIDFYDIWMKEYIRGRIMEGLDLEILAG